MSLVIVFGLISLLNSANRWYAFNKFTSILNGSKQISENSIITLGKMDKFIGDDPNFILHYTNSLMGQNDIDEGIKLLEKGLKYTPERELYYKLPYLYELKGSHSKAENIYFLIVNNYPNLLYPKYLLALHYYRTNQIKKWETKANDVLFSEMKIESEATNLMRTTISNLLYK